MKEFKPWLMAMLTFFFLFFLMPGINSTSSLFVVPVTQELGMSRSLYSLTFSVLYIVQFAVSFFYGKIYKMVSLRTLLLILTIVAVASCVISALAQNIFTVFLGAALRGFVLGLGLVPIAATIITNWFDKRRGLVLGIVFASSGFGGMALMSTFTLWVNSPDIGWRMAYFYIAAVIGVPMLIISFFLKATPEEAGLKPYGYDFSRNESVQNNLEFQGATLSEARKTLTFYLCILLIFLICVTLNGMYLHLASFFSDVNVTTAQMGLAFSLISVGIAAGKLLYGFISDKFGIAATLSVMALANLISTALFLTNNSGILLMTASVFYGMAIGITQLLVGLLAGLFGKKDYSSIVGFFSAVMALAMAAGAYILGFVYDIRQTYTDIFMVYAVIVCIAAILGFFLKKGGTVPIESTSILAGTPYETPAYILKSGQAGPAAIVLGGVHGNEPGGSRAAARLLDIKLQKGTLIVIPEVNKKALQASERTLPQIGDVNRAYPGKQDGLPAERLTYEIIELVRQYRVSMLIDLHESRNFHKVNPDSLGQSIISADNDRSALLTLSALNYINRQIEEPVRQFISLKHPATGSGAYYAGKYLDIAAFTVETSITQPLAERVRQHYEITWFLLKSEGLVN